MGRKSNAPQRRKQIVQALYDCLAEKGHETVTVKEIAGRAGLPPGVIHYYFRSKDEIISCLAETIVTRYSGRIEQKLQQARSHEERIERAIDFIVDQLVFDRPLNRVFYNLVQMAFERRELNGVVRKLFRDYRFRLTQVLEQAGAGPDSRLLGAAMVAVTEGFALQLMVDPKAVARPDVHRLIARSLELYLMRPQY